MMLISLLVVVILFVIFYKTSGFENCQMIDDRPLHSGNLPAYPYLTNYIKFQASFD